jgi:predicted phosphate transport protein (TIGR00153 family)
MFSRFVPKEYGFFDHFNKMASIALDVTREFQELIAHPNAHEKHRNRIKSMEQMADEITHSAIGMLHRTFITPMDREDIFQLIKRLDDVIDFIDGAAERFIRYEIGDVPREIHTLTEITVDAVACMKRAIEGLRDMKNTDALLKDVVELNRLENHADQVFRDAVARLFREEQDVRTLLKLKEVLELLETVTDRAEDVGNVVETIVMEYA